MVDKDYTEDPFYEDLGFWQNDSFMFNMTAPNTSSVLALTPVLPPVIDKIINTLLIVVLFITMVSMGCTMEVSKIKVTSASFCPYVFIRLICAYEGFFWLFVIISAPKHLFLCFQGHIVKPKGVTIAVLAQYGVMPLTAFCLARVCIAAITTQAVHNAWCSL